MPRLERVRLFPIKSLGPADVGEAAIGPGGGLVGDRAYALVDDAGNVAHAKRFPTLHRVRATYTEVGGVAVTVRLESAADPPAESFRLPDQSADVAAWMSVALGQPVRMIHEPDGGVPDDPENGGPTLVASATLEAVAAWFPEVAAEPTDRVVQMRERFRANLEIGDAPAFWEDLLVAGFEQAVLVEIGAARLWGVTCCQRCAVPTRDPWTAEVVSGFAKRFSQRRAETLGPDVDRTRFDHFYRLTVNTRVPADSVGRTIRVGDPVRRVGPVPLP